MQYRLVMVISRRINIAY
ncbi:hypothetical protein EC960109_4998A, partial [Escherichia coli 96.0109]